MSLIFSLVVRISAFLFEIVVWNTMLVWPSPKVLLLSLNVPKVWGVRYAKRFVRDGDSDSLCWGSTCIIFHRRVAIKCLWQPVVGICHWKQTWEGWLVYMMSSNPWTFCLPCVQFQRTNCEYSLLPGSEGVPVPGHTVWAHTLLLS